MATSAGFQSISLLNVNALYIQGVPFNDNQPSLQAEIDAINAQLVGIEAVTDKINTSGLTLPPQCIITNATTNQALKTLIDNINVDIAKLNKFDLTGLPAPQTCIITTATTNQALQTQIDNITIGFDQKFDLSAIPANPPGAIIITPTTTNQALKTLIDANTAVLDKFDLTAMAAAPPATITITPATTNQALKILIDNINTAITAINNKIAHFSTFNYGADVMSGIADGTGFAAAVTGGADYPNGNGIWIRPNSTTQTEQIVMATAYQKEILIRGGNAVKIYGGDDGTITTRNIVELGDKTDVIKIGTNNGGLTDFPEVEIGVDGTLGITRDSSTTLKGDVYFSDQVSTSGIYNIAPYTPVLVADTVPGVNFGNCNNFTTDPTFSGLDVVAPAGVAPITLSAGIGLIALTALAGGITLTTGAGAMSLACGAGGFSLSTGAGLMNLATSSANIEMGTLTGNISIGPGKSVGGSAGNLSLNAAGNVIIQPDTQTEIYKAAFVELNDNAAAPPITANRLYQQADALYWNGQLVQGGAGNQYVLKAGDTMTGALTLPEAIAAVLTLDNLTVAPNPVTNRLYLLNGTLYFSGSAIGGGGASYVLKSGDTMTGALNIIYDAGTSSQLIITNTNAVNSTGGAISIRNDSAGPGSIGERCGKIDFAGRDSASGGGRTYAAIQAYINDPTQSAIDGRLSSFVASNNTLTEFQRFISTSTGVRQVNIAANYTTIGANALGSAALDNLTVLGTTNSTISLQTPLIFNAAAIYPATSTTLVDGAVKRYRPERVFKITDYPAPLTAPTIDGEKVIVLNSFGNPVSQVDSILQASDFPALPGGLFSNIILSKYVDATNNTPAMNVIAANYSNLVVQLFVQPDVAGALSLIHIATLSINGVASIADFCVTTYSNRTRIYAGGGFNTIDIPAPYAASANVYNFSGQISITWASGVVANITHTPMLSSSTAQDSSSFQDIPGVNNTINCVIDVTGNAGFPQPAVVGDKNDSIVIGGFFFSIGPGSPSPNYRPLQNLAWYDYTAGGGSAVTLYSQAVYGVSNFYPPTQYKTFGTWVQATTQNIVSLNVQCTFSYEIATFGTPTCEVVMELINASNPSVVLAATPIQVVPDGQVPLNINVQFSPSNYTFVAGQTYIVRSNVADPQTLQGNIQYIADLNSPQDPRLIVTGTQITGQIGWRPFQSANWTVPEGPSGTVFGGGLCASGYLAFAYQGNQVITASSPLASDSIFALYYMSGTATWDIVSDADLIQSGSGSSPDQTWNYLGRNVNCVTGGNPVLAYGTGNAIAYNELYFNTGFSATSLAGVSFRRTNVDPYEMTDVLVINGVSGASLATNQLLPQFSSSICYSVYRDDTKYLNTYFLARGTQLDTASFSPATPIPNYSTITNAGVPITCFTFGGYSDEVGYTGALFATNTNLFVYKFAAGGELVIELSGCVVRTFNDVTPSQPILATNKLTFPVNTDGGSVTLCGDTSTNPASWWAISQDGPLYYDNTLIGGSGGSGGVNSVTASGSGITAVNTSGAVVIANTGVTSIIAGTNISVSSATGDVTINAAETMGFLRYAFSGNPLTPGGTGNLMQCLGQNAATANSIFQWTTQTSATGIAAGAFSLGNNCLNWNGSGSISVVLQVNVMLTLYEFNPATSTYDEITIDAYPNQLQQHIGFGASVQVMSGGGSSTTLLPASQSFFITAASTQFASNNAGALIGTLIGSCTFTTILNQGNSLRLEFLGSGNFNNEPNDKYRVLFEDSNYTLNNGGITLMINRCPPI